MRSRIPIQAAYLISVAFSLLLSFPVCAAADNACDPIAPHAIWLASGQSNMAAQREKMQLSPKPINGIAVMQHDYFVPEFNIEQWTSFEQSRYFSWVAGAFAQHMAALTRSNVQVYADAASGQTIACWTEGDCYDHFSVMQGCPIKGLLWWQGESNALSNNESDTIHYLEQTRAFFTQIRQDFHHPTLPILMVQLQKFCRNWENERPQETCLESERWHSIRRMQAELADSDPNIHLLDASLFTYGELHPQYAYDRVGRQLALLAAWLE